MTTEKNFSPASQSEEHGISASIYAADVGLGLLPKFAKALDVRTENVGMLRFRHGLLDILNTLWRQGGIVMADPLSAYEDRTCTQQPPIKELEIGYRGHSDDVKAYILEGLEKIWYQEMPLKGMKLLAFWYMVVGRFRNTSDIGIGSPSWALTKIAASQPVSSWDKTSLNTVWPFSDTGYCRRPYPAERVAVLNVQSKTVLLHHLDDRIDRECDIEVSLKQMNAFLLMWYFHHMQTDLYKHLNTLTGPVKPSAEQAYEAYSLFLNRLTRWVNSHGGNLHT